MPTTVSWIGSATATPPARFSQDECYRMAGYERRFPEDARKLKAIFRSCGVASRALWLREGEFEPTDDPNDFHRRYISGVRAIAPAAARAALRKAGWEGSGLDFVVFVSCTGFTVPGFSVELARELGVAEDRPTASLLGMGCSALVPALERACDRLRAQPGSRALVVAAEICSATYWIDSDPEATVGNALFGDGAAAVLLSSREEDAPRALGRIEGFATVRDGRYLDSMGFTHRDGRLRVRLDRTIPETILPLVERMLARLELAPGTRLAIHPGGRKILDLVEERLGAGHEAIRWSREVLAENGNMSSPTVAFVLDRSFEARPVAAGGEPGVVLTMGPGLSVEAMRVRWLRNP